MLSIAFVYVIACAAPAPDGDSLVIYDLTPLRARDLANQDARREVWDTCHLVAALQGLANRDAPRLYLRWIEPADGYWLAWLRSPGHWLTSREIVELKSIEALLARFTTCYRGVVLYAEDPAPLSNLASTIAGSENLLPVRKDERPGSLYSRLVAGGPRLPVRVDLTQETFPAATGSAKCDPYLWAKARYLAAGKCDPAYLAYYIDTYWLAEPFKGSHENHTLSNHDFFIAKKAFFFDLHPWDDEAPNDDPTQKVGTDAATLKAILRAAYDGTGGRTVIHAGGFVPWAWKYCNHTPGASRHEPVPSEWRYAELLSCYNAIMDADALGSCAMANASFFTHYPLRARYPQGPAPTDESLVRAGALSKEGLVAPGTYVCFYVGDYDSAAWIYREFPHCWDDPARGKVALGWALNPNLERRAPMALAYARETASALDVFTAGDSGAGYLNPGGLQEPRTHSGLPSGVKTWEEFCRPFYARWDLRVTGFIIDGYSPAMDKETWDAYARFSPGGVGGQKMAPQGLHGHMPFIRVIDAPHSPEELATMVAAAADPDQRRFFYFRTILKTASWHKRVQDLLAASAPSARIVDPHAFFALLARYERDKKRYAAPAWNKPAIAWAPDAADGLRIFPFADGPFELREIGGRKAAMARADHKASYLYAAAHDGFAPGEPATLRARVTYLDTRGGRFSVHYDSRTDPYASTDWVALEGTDAWKETTLALRDARFSNRQNGGADLRLCIDGGVLAVARLVIDRPEAAANAPTPPAATRPAPRADASDAESSKPDALWHEALALRDTLQISTLFTAQDVQGRLSGEQGLADAIAWAKSLRVTRVFIESYRDGMRAAKENLVHARDRFAREGFRVAGCITPTKVGKQSTGWNLISCYTDAPTRAKLAGEFAYAASMFDLIMIDDFFFTDCACPECTRAKGEKSWPEYRLDLMCDVSARDVLGAARAVNPAVKLILKYPQWYDKFHERGYDVARQPGMYDYIWVGTETRDPDSTQWGRKAQYEAYFIMRWLGGIGGEKCGGGWFDPYGTAPATYVEQARQTVLAGAREMLLFCYGSLRESRAERNTEALAKELDGLFTLAAWVRGGAPRGIPAIKPAGSPADPQEEYLFDFVGMLGLPLVPCHVPPEDAPALLVTTHLKKDAAWKELLARHLAAGRPVLAARAIVREVESLRAAAGKGTVVPLVWEGDMRTLMDLPAARLDELRAPLLQPLGLSFKAPGRVALYFPAERVVALENFADAPANVTLRDSTRAFDVAETLVLPPTAVPTIEVKGDTITGTVPPRTLVVWRLK